jgi:predicted transcriptional regulator
MNKEQIKRLEEINERIEEIKEEKIYLESRIEVLEDELKELYQEKLKKVV